MHHIRFSVALIALAMGRTRRTDEIVRQAVTGVERFVTAEWLAGAPFHGISLQLQAGRSSHLGRAGWEVRDGWLELSPQFDVQRVKWFKLDYLPQVFRLMLLEVLVAIADRYRLPSNELRAEWEQA